jgi:hypothetical protein
MSLYMGSHKCWNLILINHLVSDAGNGRTRNPQTWALLTLCRNMWQRPWTNDLSPFKTTILNKIIYIKLHIFKRYYLVHFHICRCSWNHHQTKDRKYLHLPQMFSWVFVMPPWPSEHLLVCFLSLSINLHFVEFHINELTHNILFDLAFYIWCNYVEIHHGVACVKSTLSELTYWPSLIKNKTVIADISKKGRESGGGLLRSG